MVVKLVLLVGPPLIRQTEGFLRSLAHMLEVDLPIPDGTTLSRRLQKLGGRRFRRARDGSADPSADRQYGAPHSCRSSTRTAQEQGLEKAASRGRRRHG